MQRSHRSGGSLFAATLLVAAGCGGSLPSTSGVPPICDPAPWSGDAVPRLRVPFDASYDPAVDVAGLSAVPTLLNEAEVRSTIVEEFVSVMLDQDPVPTGVVRSWLLVGTDGDIEAVEMAESSGHEALDEISGAVVRRLDLTPAVRGSCRVPIWVLYPIRFEVGG